MMEELSKNEEATSRHTSLPAQESAATTGSGRSAGVDKRWKTEGNIEITNQFDLNQEILCVSYTETYDFLAAGCTDGSVRLFKISTGEDAMVLRDTEMLQNPAPCTAIIHRPVVHKSHPVSHTLLATYVNGCVKCWHYPTSQCVYTIRERRQVLGIAYHHHLPQFVTVGDDANLCLYDEETKTQLRVFHGSDAHEIMDGHRSRVFSACFNPKSAHELISGGWDDTVQFWDTRQPTALRHISGVHMCGDGIDISKNGKDILTCSWQRKDPIQLWEYSTGKLIVSLEPDSSPSLLYCGQYISNLFFACGGTDTELFRIVDLRSHATMASIKNLSGGVYSLQMGPLPVKLPKKSTRVSAVLLPQIAFCAGKTIFEVNAQLG